MMKSRIPSLDEFVNEGKSTMMDVGDMFVIDWDGKSQVKITDITKDEITIVRVDKNGKELKGEENTMIASPAYFKGLAAGYFAS